MNENFYVQVNLKDKKILDSPKKLDLNWNNISGLCFLSDESLSDLEWAGYPDIGFIKYDKQNLDFIGSFSIDLNIFLEMKINLKNILSEIRYKYETNGVIIDNRYQFSTSDRSKLLMQGKYLECIGSDPLKEFNWKTQSGNVRFSSEEFIKVFNKIQEFIQETFDIELEYIKKIDESRTVLDLFSVDINSINWNSNIIKL